MMYTSYIYLVLFLGITFFLYTIMPKKYKWAVLLTASYVFYIINARKYIIFLLSTTISIYIGGLILNKISDWYSSIKPSLSKEERKPKKKIMQREKKAVLALIVLFNLGLLVFLKYYNFFSTSTNVLLENMNANFTFPLSRFLLPLGISFYTLGALSYIIDVYRGKYRGCKTFSKVALFMSFFPQIVEGPIGRFDLIADDLYEGHSFNYENFSFGLKLIAWGLFKKLVIADRANGLVNTVFDAHQNYSGIIVVIAILLYSLQLYTEFSGCMDIVCGSAKLFSVNLASNFERPFFSKSVSEFWRRWHITLGAWFRDYLFYSVSLSKGFLALNKWSKKHLNAFLGNLIPVSIALFCVWFSTGLWHGASFKYIAYGLYYYVIMMIGMLFAPVSKKVLGILHLKETNKAFAGFQIFRTFILVNLGMMIFRASSLTASIEIFKSIFVNFSLSPIFNGTVLKLGIDKYDFLVLAISVVFLLIVNILEEKGHHIIEELSSKNIVIRWSVYFAVIFAMIIFGAYGNGYGPVDFIYSQF
ncbi:MAG: MBOAT family protein [Oscillospiraceae bacterium]